MALREGLPDAELVFTKNLMHELLSAHSDEELECSRVAGQLCQKAMEAIVARARPGVTEYQLKAAAAHAILDGGGDVDFVILGSTPMDRPSMVFGNPRPSSRVVQSGDLVMMEPAAAYRGYSAQIGTPICVGRPPAPVRRFFDEIVLPGFELLVKEVGPGKPLTALQDAGTYFRQQGAQSRPIHVHGIDLISSEPHISTDRVDGEPFEQNLRPGMVLVVEPTPITADGMLGMFFGHTFIVTPAGHEGVDEYPWEMLEVPA